MKMKDTDPVVAPKPSVLDRLAEAEKNIEDLFSSLRTLIARVEKLEQLVGK